MSQILSSLPNKFDQGIFAALCFDFSLSKNFVSYYYAFRLVNFVILFFNPALALQFLVAIGSAKVKPFFTPATIFIKKTVYFYLNFLKLSLSVK